MCGLAGRGLSRLTARTAIRFGGVSTQASEEVCQMSAFKLGTGDFGTFEALEVLTLGVRGKRALWRALAAVAKTDARVRGVDYEQLSTRAESRQARVEDIRIRPRWPRLHRTRSDNCSAVMPWESGEGG